VAASAATHQAAGSQPALMHHRGEAATRVRSQPSGFMPF
jgi:hypothetical protein